VIPSQTHKIIGPGQTLAASIWASDKAVVITGSELADLKCLVTRLGVGGPMTGDEMRDWRNRLNLILTTSAVIQREAQ
jgi:hypothetical protein